MGVKGYFYLGIFSIGMFAWGGQGMYTAVRNPKPASYTVDAYLAEQPNKQWLNLENAELNLLNAAYFGPQGSDRIDEAYVPIYSVNDENRNTVRILLSTENPEILETLETLETEAEGSEEALFSYVIDNEEEIFITRPVQGTVTFGLTADTETKVELKDLYGSELAEDVIIIKDGAKPSYLLSILALAAGSLSGGFLLKLLVFNGRRTQAAPA